jgi:hypothetical protein
MNSNINKETYMYVDDQYLIIHVGGHEFDSWWLPWIFFSCSWRTSVGEIEELWYSSTHVILVSSQ